MKKAYLIQALNVLKFRSTWNYAVREYALGLVQAYNGDDIASAREVSNHAGADKMRLRDIAYDLSHGGCALIYDEDIAARVCTSSELRKLTRKDGSLRDHPNARESWLDVQARVIFQALRLIDTVIEKYKMANA